MHARIAVPGDETAVSALLLASYTKLMAKDYDASVLAAALPGMVRANPALLASGTFYVVDGPAASIIGCGGWTRAAPGTKTETPNLAHLRHFAAHPDFARQGIARVIYTQCANAAKSANITHFQAYASLTSIPFYASLGLDLIRTFDVQLGDNMRFPAALMEGEILSGPGRLAPIRTFSA
jgi:GNAT superfamily N-acetyltransferase